LIAREVPDCELRTFPPQAGFMRHNVGWKMLCPESGSEQTQNYELLRSLAVKGRPTGNIGVCVPLGRSNVVFEFVGTSNMQALRHPHDASQDITRQSAM
jgi:hypothetical protein